jgi:hypothetical protein
MANGGAGSLDYKTCMSWLSPAKHPNTVTEANKVALLHALFGDCDAERLHYREAMDRAWLGARGLLLPKAAATSPPPTTRPAGEDWAFVDQPETLHPQLVALSLQPPLAINTRPGEGEGFQIYAALRLSQQV